MLINHHLSNFLSNLFLFVVAETDFATLVASMFDFEDIFYSELIASSK